MTAASEPGARPAGQAPQWGVVAALAMQVLVMVWTAGAAHQRLARLERDVGDLPARVVRLEAQLSAIQGAVASLDAKLDRLLVAAIGAAPAVAGTAAP